MNESTKKQTTKKQTTKKQTTNTPKPIIKRFLIIMLCIIILILSTYFTYRELHSNNIFWKLQGFRSIIYLPFLYIILILAIYFNL